jgi:hypothetical protein
MNKMRQHKLFWGLLHRRECLVPTWRAIFAAIFFSIALMVIGLLAIHPFLGVTEPVSAEVLVVEGWVPDYVFEEARVEFERHHYRKLYVTGGALEVGVHLSEYKTYAELGAATLIRMGVGKAMIEAVPSPSVRQDRTFTSALALKRRLHDQALEHANINLVSVGAHARRSQLLFQKVFGKDLRVGIIAIENRGYDPRCWWRSSAGVRTILDEFIAYLYAVLVFPFVEFGQVN